MNREDIAWAAGLFEGEGWITIQGNSPSIGVQLSDKEVLIKLQEALEVGRIHSRSIGKMRKYGISSRKPRWTWRVTSFELVQATLAKMWPWLGSRRKARAKEVLLKARSSPRAQRRRAYDPVYIAPDRAEHVQLPCLVHGCANMREKDKPRCAEHLPGTAVLENV